eukprot:6152653-Pyramimonas_sp.AAC.1
MCRFSISGVDVVNVALYFSPSAVGRAYGARKKTVDMPPAWLHVGLALLPHRFIPLLYTDLNDFFSADNAFEYPAIGPFTHHRIDYDGRTFALDSCLLRKFQSSARGAACEWKGPVFWSSS